MTPMHSLSTRHVAALVMPSCIWNVRYSIFRKGFHAPSRGGPRSTRVTRQLACGGLTRWSLARQVYKALRHGTLEVAVKHIPCAVDDPHRLAQMSKEIAIMKRVSFYKHIVQFYGACVTNSGAWVCMELMEVRTLRPSLTQTLSLMPRLTLTLFQAFTPTAQGTCRLAA